MAPGFVLAPGPRGPGPKARGPGLGPGARGLGPGTGARGPGARGPVWSGLVLALHDVIRP